MNTRDTQAIVEKLKELAPEQLAEVESFVDFLRSRADARTLSAWPPGFFENTVGAVPDFPDVLPEGDSNSAPRSDAVSPGH